MPRVFCCALILAMFTAGAHAQELSEEPSEAPGRKFGDLYFSLSGGAIFPEDSEIEDFIVSNDLSFDTGYGVNAALGTYLSEIFRVEAEIGWRDADLDDWKLSGFGSTPDFSGDMNILSGMANVYADIPVHEKVDIYIGGGLGVGYVDMKINSGGGSDSDEDTVFAYQGMAGLGWQLSEAMTLTGGYRLWTSEDISFEGTDLDSPLIHTVEVGLRFDF